MSSNLHTLAAAVARNKLELVDLWNKQLQNLCHLLNAAAKSGRKFDNDRYFAFLEDLRRIGIIYNKKVFEFQPHAAEWYQLVRDDSAFERARQDAIDKRFRFYQNLPLADKGFFFNDCANDTDEQALATAIIDLKKFQDEYVEPLILAGRYDPMGVKAEDPTEPLLSSTRKIEAYQSISKSQQEEAKTLGEKFKIQQNFMRKVSDNLAVLDPNLQEKVKSALSTIEETLKLVVNLPAELREINNRLGLKLSDEALKNLIPQPLLDNMDKLSTVLVDLMKDQDETALISVSMMAITLEEEVLKVQRKLVQDARNKIAEENSSLTEKVRPYTDSLQEIEQIHTKIKERSELRQKLDELPAEIDELSKMESNAQKDLDKAKKVHGAAKKDYEEAKKEKTICYENIEAIREKITEIGLSKEYITEEMADREGKIKTIAVKLGEKNMQKSALNPQSPEDAKRELQTKIDTLIQNHPFLDNSFWGTVWLARSFRKSDAHEHLAKRLDSIKSALNQAKTHEEILIQTEALNKAIKEAEEMQGKKGWEKNTNREHRLKAIQTQCTNYKQKRAEVGLIENEIKELENEKTSLEKQQTQGKEAIENFKREQFEKEKESNTLQQAYKDLERKASLSFSAFDGASSSKTQAKETLDKITKTVDEKKAELIQIQTTLAKLPDKKEDDKTLAEVNSRGAGIENLRQGIENKITENKEKIEQFDAEIGVIQEKIKSCENRLVDVDKKRVDLAQGKASAPVSANKVHQPSAKQEKSQDKSSLKQKKASRKKKKGTNIVTIAKAESLNGEMPEATQKARETTQKGLSWLKPSVSPVTLDTGDISHNRFGQFYHNKSDDSAKITERELVKPVGGHS